MKLYGLLRWILGQTDKRKNVSAILMMMPAMRTVAYFMGLPSKRNLAKAKVDRASKPMIKALQVIYSGWWRMPIISAIAPLNTTIKAVKAMVLKMRDMVAVLY